MSNPFAQQQPVVPQTPAPPAQPQPAQVVQPVAAQPQQQPPPAAQPAVGDPLGDPGASGGAFYQAKDHVGRIHVFAGLSRSKLGEFPHYQHGSDNDPCAVVQLAVVFDENATAFAYQQVMLPQQILTNQLTGPDQKNDLVLAKLKQPSRAYELIKVERTDIRDFVVGWMDANVPGWRTGDYACAVAAPPPAVRQQQNDDDDGF